MFRRLGLCGSVLWKMTKVSWQVVYGVWRLSKIKGPFVSVFGGSRLSQESPYATQANELAQKLVDEDISVITGGGAGVMHAANCGAVESSKDGGDGKSIGIGVRDLNEGRNPCVQEYFELDYFFARKYLLTRYSRAFIIFPGCFGTMDELSELLTLVMTEKMPQVPIVLVGVEYWKPFMMWVNESAVKNDLIPKQVVKLFTVTDDMYQAFCLAKDECKRSE